MLNKILLPSILLLLAYGFWMSPDFKVICAGIAIFLFGMLGMERGFKAFTGGTLEKILSRCTDSTWKSVGFGIVTTSIMQSSSLVSVITISFLSAGLITLTQGVGIIFGSNLGTTTGAWLVAAVGMKVNISAYAMPMLAFGAILVMQKKPTVKGLGFVLSGIGFLFLGIHYMKEGFEAFKSGIDLASFAMTGVKGLLVYTLIGAAATVVMQSSHATMVLTITALSAGQVTYENALALAIGANIGTTVTAVLGAISANIEGRRLAAAHLVFNSVTGAIALIFISPMMQSVDWICAHVGIAADDYTLKLSVFHTLFNLLGVAVMLPLLDKLVAYLQRVMPDPERRVTPELPKGRVEQRHQPERAFFLNESALYSGDTMLKVMIAEVRHLVDKALSIAAYCLYFDKQELYSDKPLETQVAQTNTRDYPTDFDTLYNVNIKEIYSDIVAFTAHTPDGITPGQTALMLDLKVTVRGIINVLKDIKHLRKNLTIHLTGDDQVAREQYNHIRLLLAQVLRQIDLVRHQREINTILVVDRLRVAVKTWEGKFEQRLQELLKRERISGQLASSLLNDSYYAIRISDQVISILQTIHGADSSGQSNIADYLTLNEEEIDQVIQGLKDSRIEQSKVTEDREHGEK